MRYITEQWLHVESCEDVSISEFCDGWGIDTTKLRKAVIKLAGREPKRNTMYPTKEEMTCRTKKTRKQHREDLSKRAWATARATRKRKAPLPT